MAHALDMTTGQPSFAYAGEKPWHGLGKEVPADLTPAQMMEAAGLDWTVEKVPAFVTIGGEQVKTSHSALVRSDTNAILDMVTNDWNPVQNQEAFEFFNEFVMAGDMRMETAGSLRDGQKVFGLARIGESFELFKGKDVIDNFLLFSNFHKFGHATDVRATGIRVVCNNTHTMALGQNAERMVRISHRVKFDPNEAKVMMGLAHEKFELYKEAAEHMSTKLYTVDQMKEYFSRIFPVSTAKGKEAKKDMSANAKQALEIKDTQPGAELGEGTFWQLYNTVTYMTDHVLGKTQEVRLDNAWFGHTAKLKNTALKLAVEMADA